MSDPVVIQDHTPGGVPSTFYEVQVPVDPQCWPVEICTPLDIATLPPIEIAAIPVKTAKERAWELVTANVANPKHGGPRDRNNDAEWEKMFIRSFEIAVLYEATIP